MRGKVKAVRAGLVNPERVYVQLANKSIWVYRKPIDPRRIPAVAAEMLNVSGLNGNGVDLRYFKRVRAR